MKKVLSIAFMVVALVISTKATAQDFNGLDKSPLDNATYPPDYKVSKKAIRITYSRPQLKGRSLAQLAPTGKVWRTGANEAPEITFYKDVILAETQIKAGTYALLTIPGEKEWTIILHSSLNQWGAYFYKETSDVARVKAQVSAGDKSLEEFSIMFKESNSNVDMILGWDKTRVTLPISIQ